MAKLFGVLPVDKPEGWTSHDAVAYVRKRYQFSKVGHTGTIDPFGTGLLLLCIGSVTRLSTYLSSMHKTYAVSAKFGVETDTYDVTGETVAEAAVPEDLEAQALAALREFVGETEQVPPMYSAIKYQGKPLYKLARKGVTLDLPPRKVRIYDIRNVSFDGPVCRFEIHCGPGMYVRSLVHDLGKKIGCGAVTETLRRTAIGDVTVENARQPKDLPDELTLVSPASVLADWPKIPLRSFDASFLAGHDISISNLVDTPAVEPGQMVFLEGKDGLIGFGQIKAGKIHKMGSFV